MNDIADISASSLHQATISRVRDYILTALKSCGWTQAQLAEKANISKSRLSEVLSKKSKSLLSLDAIERIGMVTGYFYNPDLSKPVAFTPSTNFTTAEIDEAIKQVMDAYSTLNISNLQPDRDFATDVITRLNENKKAAEHKQANSNEEPSHVASSAPIPPTPQNSPPLPPFGAAENNSPLTNPTTKGTTPHD